MQTIANVHATVVAEPRRFPARILATLAVTGLLLGCSGDADGASAPLTEAATVPAVPAPASAPEAAAALSAYGEFWRISEEAFAAPGSKDWAAELSAVARGQALEDVMLEIRNYASVPAHVEGTITHQPVVDAAAAPAPDRVAIVDCVDISNSDLVSDGDGRVLDDEVNETPRYLYRALVVRDDSGRWLVDTTTPFLNQPC
jgi:hypothetical protein